MTIELPKADFEKSSKPQFGRNLDRYETPVKEMICSVGAENAAELSRMTDGRIIPAIGSSKLLRFEVQ